jgi:hypothetical protein
VTRRSKHSVKERLDELESDPTADPAISVSIGGDPAEPDTNADLRITINESVVMNRERAEREGHEILGPAENAPPENDAVRIAWEDADS